MEVAGCAENGDYGRLVNRRLPIGSALDQIGILGGCPARNRQPFRNAAAEKRRELMQLVKNTMGRETDDYIKCSALKGFQQRKI